MTINELIIKDFEKRMNEISKLENKEEQKVKAYELMQGVFIFALGEESGNKLFKEFKELTA